MPTTSEISTRLTADNSQFSSVMNQTVRTAQEAGHRLTKNLDLRDAMKSIVFAFGLDVQSIAENVARFVTGVSKETEEQLKELAATSEQVAEAVKKNLKASLSDEQRYQQALQLRDHLQQKIADNIGSGLRDQVQLNKDRLAQEEAIGEIQAYEREQAKKARSESDTASKIEMQRADELRAARREADGENLSTAEKIARAKDEILLRERAIQSGALETANVEKFSQEIQERKIELIKLEKDRSDEANARAEESLKRFFGGVEDLAAAKKTADEAELARRNEIRSAAAAETAEYEKQLAIKKAQADFEFSRMSSEGVAGAINSGRILVDGKWYSGRGRTSSDLANVDSATLEELVRRNMAEILKIKANEGLTTGGIAEASSGYITRGIATAALQTEINAANYLLSQRRQVAADYARGGESLALRNFAGDPTQFKAVLQESVTRTDVQSLTSAIEQMNQNLKRGVPVVIPGSN